MSKFLTAKQLGILPEERKALIAFVQAPSLGRAVAVNGHAHYYTQPKASDDEKAKQNECGTAGCVGGFVFAHVRHVQGKNRLRGTRNAEDYLSVATDDEFDDEKAEYVGTVPLLYDLFRVGDEYKLATARRVVTRMLRTKKVKWPEPDAEPDVKEEHGF